MTHPRFHLPGLPAPPEVATLRGAEHHHLRNVLRLAEGDSVSLFDGEGRAAAGRILAVDRAEARIALESEEDPRESPLDLTLLVALPKGEKFDLVLQKAAELGVRRVVPVVSERSEIRIPPEREAGRLKRWRRILLEACKQSGRSRLPGVEPPRGVFEALDRDPGGIRLVLHPSSDSAGFGPSLPPRPDTRVTLGVGPEGGWSEGEVTRFREAGARLFSLGPRTLRAETAAIVAAAIVQFLAGDLGSAAPRADGIR
jgi:16S rRNA (uracil1498-N3)-methyltransferase